MFTIPDAYDVRGRPDPLAEVAEEDGVPAQYSSSSSGERRERLFQK